jgi:hypothetical protein
MVITKVLTVQTEDLMEPKKIPPRMRNYDHCGDCWGSIEKKEGDEIKLWCEKYGFYTDENGLCDGYVD